MSLRNLALLALLLPAACTSHGFASTGGATSGHSDAGQRDAGHGDAGTGFLGSLAISPRQATLDVGAGYPGTITFTATADGQPVSPTWTTSPASLGGIDGTGLFTASGSAGTATINASYGAASDTTTLLMRLHLSQNGSVDAGPDADAGSSTGAGGVGGVGGEGEGPPVDPATLAVLATAPTAEAGLSLLYPYDGTVWPQGILPPLLQWQNGANLPSAVGIHLECASFVWDGAFGATASPFVHHPIPRGAWDAMGRACAGQTVLLRLVFASGGVAYGPLTESWTQSAGALKGVVYYNSYGTKLAYNYSGALPNGGPFGGATLAVHGGSTDPVLVAGQSGGVSDCRVCHVVSADGSTLLSEHGDNYSASSTYALQSGNAETPLSPADGRYAWGALSPDGTLLFSNSAPLFGASLAPSALYDVPSGTAVATNGIPVGLQAGTPVFSPDGTQVAFNWYGGSFSGSAGDQRTLAMMHFTRPDTFDGFRVLYTPAGTQAALYPSFLPTGAGIVFENEVQSDGRGFGETRSTCDGSGACSETGARGELWWVDLASGQAAPLGKLNGAGYLPVGPNGHDADATLNYEPTVSPIASGGYAWVIFTSRRMYGNVATINPYWSDPRFHDISQTPTPKKLWVSAVDLNAPAGSDPSHPAFYLPAQELLAGNSRGYWSLTPCKQDGKDCQSGDECCGGFCEGDSELGGVCGSTSTGCSQVYERCTTDADCCSGGNGVTCVNGVCTVVFR